MNNKMCHSIQMQSNQLPLALAVDKMTIKQNDGFSQSYHFINASGKKK